MTRQEPAREPASSPCQAPPGYWGEDDRKAEGFIALACGVAVMIPDFNDQGYLPPGVHGATLDEIADRFGGESELRHAEMESLRWLVDLARRAGVLRIVVNGSFVADAYEPNDVDCALLLGSDYPTDPAADAELQQGLPFIQVEMLTREAFEYYVHTIFGADRRGVPKGQIEVLP